MKNACAKIILLGEHSVVHGYPAIAVGLAKGASATAQVHPIDELVLSASTNFRTSTQKNTALRKAFHTLLACYDPINRPPLHVQVEVHIPTGAGLGSSAAIGVAVVRAVDELLGLNKTPEQQATIALEWEKYFHGNPSGIDTITSALGGTLWFQKGHPSQRIHHQKPYYLVIAHSGHHSATKTMVESIRKQQLRNPQKINNAFEAISKLVHAAKHALSNDSHQALGLVLNQNHKLLQELELSTPRIDSLCQFALECGALGAKLSGAGGGGCMFALCDSFEKAQHVQKELQTLHTEPFIEVITDSS
jgi:mevalonate kinase